MNKKDKIKKMKGITLVSLVVTIIVLIILAGVSINLTLGENGIITMAKRARENMELAKEDEERQLNESYTQIITEGGSSGNVSDDAIIRLAQFKREIASAITDMGIATSETADATTMSSNIRSLTVGTSADKVSYDNTESGLTSTNVQGAVDELNDNLIHHIETSNVENTITLSASDTNYTVEKSGYIGFHTRFSKNSTFCWYQIQIDGLTIESRTLDTTSNTANGYMTIPVKKGQVVTFRYSENAILAEYYLIPNNK